jgi:hypothetical protein
VTLIDEGKRGFQHWQEVIAGVAAIVGAVIGGLIAFKATQTGVEQQLSAAAHQSSVEFYRVQKQDTYSKMIADAVGVSGPISDSIWMFSYNADPSVPEVVDKRLDLHRLIAFVRNDYSAIQLVGEDPVIAAARDLWLRNGARILALEARYEQWATGHLTPDERRNSYVALQSGSQEAQYALTTFIELARKDLDSTQ